MGMGNSAIGIQRCFTTPGEDVFGSVAWAYRDARITHWQTGAVAFEQCGVEVPEDWSLNATNILAQKYFRGTLGSDEREFSLRQVVDRIVGTITGWGKEAGYFVDDDEAATFFDELAFLLLRQRAAFNSPVWFNIGVAGVPQQASACFILSVEDRMESILNWYVEEGTIFKGGSGAGVNLSRIRSSQEGLDGGGTASGPVSFMRGADASAGTIKSGGKTRRAAKMVILDVDHPDIEEFIWCKALEERKARALRDAGFDMSLDGADIHSVQYQNANNSVRVSDAFMQAVVDGADWPLVGRTDGTVLETLHAPAVMRQFAEAAWECADPGMQFDTTINRWHTTPNAGPIRGSNPCSEYMHLDNSACNLASLNLLAFLGVDDTFDTDGFSSAAAVLITAQEILVGRSDYPTEKIRENAVRFRQLGLGYTNLGALLMSLGMPYDSDAGRAMAASVTGLMSGTAYATSGRIASRMGAFAGFADDADSVVRVLGMHRDALESVGTLDPAQALVLEAARRAWATAIGLAETVGVRNAQATVLAPTGTISLLMDADTTGVEPDLGLVKTKTLVGGGTMTILNQSVPRALRRLGYGADERQEILEHIDATGSIVNAGPLRGKHLAVFAGAIGDNVIHYSGHVRMMAAVQPFISGALSKTVNLPESATVEEIEQLHIDAWRMGVKAIAIYRDNCKVAQPLTTGKAPSGVAAISEDVSGTTAASLGLQAAQRERLPRNRRSRTFEFRVADCKGFVTVGEYDDGRPGEIFVRVSKQGSTMAGIMDAFAISLSHGLQYGVPLRNFVDTFTGMRFEPAGMTDDPDVRIASSIMDYLFRKLAVLYMDPAERAAMGIFTTGERTQQTLPGVGEELTLFGGELPSDPPSEPAFMAHTTQREIPDGAGAVDHGAPMCMQCGLVMQRAGSCHACASCGNTSGCS